MYFQFFTRAVWQVRPLSGDQIVLFGLPMAFSTYFPLPRLLLGPGRGLLLYAVVGLRPWAPVGSGRCVVGSLTGTVAPG